MHESHHQGVSDDVSKHGSELAQVELAIAEAFSQQNSLQEAHSLANTQLHEAGLELEVANTELESAIERQKVLSEELASLSADLAIVSLDKAKTEKETIEPDPHFDTKVAHLLGGIESEKLHSESLKQQVDEFRELIAAQSLQIQENRRHTDEIIAAELLLRAKIESGRLETEESKNKRQEKKEGIVGSREAAQKLTSEPWKNYLDDLDQSLRERDELFKLREDRLKCLASEIESLQRKAAAPEAESGRRRHARNQSMIGQLAASTFETDSSRLDSKGVEEQVMNALQVDSQGAKVVIVED